jgi:hypothetical protein
MGLLSRLLLLRYRRRGQDLGKSSRSSFERMLTPQWKKYLTSMQITQFVIDICIVYFASMSESVEDGPSLTSSLPALRLQVLPHAPQGRRLCRFRRSCSLRLWSPDQLPLPLHRVRTYLSSYFSSRLRAVSTELPTRRLDLLAGPRRGLLSSLPTAALQATSVAPRRAR